MKPEFMRKIDDVGRIVLQMEMRSVLGWDMDTDISITMEEGRLILREIKSNK